MIKANLRKPEAILRMASGFLLFYFFLLGGPTWMLVGLYLMLTGSLRFCAVYFLWQQRQF